MQQLSKQLLLRARSLIQDAILASADAGFLSEHQCIQLFRQELDYPWSEEPLLALFQQHFLVRYCFHALYNELKIQGVTLGIHVTGIDIHLAATDGSCLPDVDVGTAELSRFYTNIDNFYSATPATVGKLIASFWEKYHATSDKSSALAELGLESDAEWREVQQKYRELAQRCHPDLGGDSEQFIAIRNAYLTLKSAMT